MPRRIGTPRGRRCHYIKEWREFRGLSQQDLADRIQEGTYKSTISRIENLKQGYTQGTLELIADVLFVHPSILLARPPTELDRLPGGSELARAVGVSPSAITQIESGGVEPKHTAFLIAQALGVSVKRLFEDTNPVAGDAPWQLWEKMSPAQQKQAIRLLKALVDTFRVLSVKRM